MRKQMWNVLGIVFMTMMLISCDSAELPESSLEITEIVVSDAAEMQAESNLEMQEISGTGTEALDEETWEETAPNMEVDVTELQDAVVSDVEVPEETIIETAAAMEPSQAELIEPESFSETEPEPVEQEPQQQEVPVIIQNEVDVSESFYAVYSEAEMNEALNQGDLATYFQMLNANSAVTMTPSAADTATAVNHKAERSCFLSPEFIDYLNIKRAEQGLDVLSLDASMEGTALERAEEIVTEFSHNGVRNCAGENLAMLNSGNVADWYDTFYSSEIHKLNMLDATYHSAAAAACQIGNTHYVVVLFGF